MTASVERFLEHLRASGLLTDGELTSLCAAQLTAHGEPTVESLTRDLVRRGRLTPYQATRCAEGKPRGLVLGNYLVLDKIGEGGMGEVFRAEHRRMKRPVVLKLLPAAQMRSEYAVRRFQREVEAAAQLSHPNVVTAYDADEADSVHFLVMEYVDGEPLGTLCGRLGPLPVATAVDYALQAARGLEYAHAKGIVHRDIKPNNLLIDTQGVVKLLDMGLARFDNPAESGVLDGERLTQANQIVGTVEYMSPEQADDSSRVDGRSDIYSLGCTLFRALAGHAPYRAASPIATLLAHRSEPVPALRPLRNDVPVRLDLAVQRMMAKQPDDRFDSMTEVIAELEACLAECGSAPAPRTFERYDDGLAPTRALDVSRGERGSGRGGDGENEVSPRVSPSPAPLFPRSPPPPLSRSPVPAVGIDLGTTYSAVAYIDSDGRPQSLANAEGDKLTPSVVLFDEGDVIVGKEAWKALAHGTERIAECAKRELGARLCTKVIGGRRYPPETIEAWILNKLRNDAERSIGEFVKVVITVPAYFDEVRRKATQDAGYMAGLEVIDIINEPTAAALAYGYYHGYLSGTAAGEPENIVVYDLGGGTFDVTVMEIRGNRFTTLATDGDMQLGGRDWDQRLVDYVANEVLHRHGLDPRLDERLLGRLWLDCEEAKRTLSARAKTTITVPLGGQPTSVEITRATFEKLTADLLERTAFTVRQTVKAAGLDWPQIQRVLLCGGSTRMPAVVRMLTELSGQAPDQSVSPDEAVAHGAALHASLLLDKHAQRPPRFHIRNVNSHSLGVVATDAATKRAKNAVLIPRNTPLPVSAKRVFRTHKAGQKSVLLQIVEGESEFPEDCSQVGRCSVRHLPPDLPAQTSIEVRFRYEENGRLTVTVLVAGTDTVLKHELSRENALTQEQLDLWRKYISGLPPVALKSQRAG